jgi:hypothetical protein
MLPGMEVTPERVEKLKFVEVKCNRKVSTYIPQVLQMLLRRQGK